MHSKCRLKWTTEGLIFFKRVWDGFFMMLYSLYKNWNVFNWKSSGTCSWWPCSRTSKTNLNFQHLNKSYGISLCEVLQSWLINTVYYLTIKGEPDGMGGGLCNNFVPIPCDSSSLLPFHLLHNLVLRPCCLLNFNRTGPLLNVEAYFLFSGAGSRLLRPVVKFVQGKIEPTNEALYPSL